MTALAFSEQYLFSGEGPFLKVHRRNDATLLSTITVFSSQAVHGIVVHETGLLVWGGHQVALFDFSHPVPEQSAPQLSLRAELKAEDWILDVSVSPAAGPDAPQTAALVTAHNALLLLRLDSTSNARGLSMVELTSNSKCILYSAHIFWMGADRILVASGTVFGDIILWSCFVRSDEAPESVLHQILVGHDGSIFGVQIYERPDPDSKELPSRLLASCSDDRTIRIWDISVLPEASASPQAATDLPSARETGFGSNIADSLPGDASIDRCIAQAWGHASRIWGVRFVRSKSPEILSHLVSFGEDATCQFWKLAATGNSTGSSSEKSYALSHVATTAAHAGKNIWASALVEKQSDKVIIASGGADGSISVESKIIPFPSESESIQSWSIGEMVAAIPEHARSAKEDKLRSYAFVNSVDLLVTTDSGNVLLLCSSSGAAHEQSTWKWISVEPSLRGYSVVTSIASLSLVFLAGIDGSVFLYDASGIRRITKCTGKVSNLLARQTSMVDTVHPDRKFATLLVTTVENKIANLMTICAPSNDGSTGTTVVNERQIQLPVSFIVTSSIVSPDNTMLVLGSRNGMFASFTLQENAGKGGPVAHDVLVHGAHDKDAITDIDWVAGPATGNQMSHIFSVGRDGSYGVHQISKSGSATSLRLINRTSLAPGTILEGIRVDQESKKVLVWGFHSKQMIVVDVTKEQELIRVNCGGANRSWAFEPLNLLSGGAFAWTKASDLCLTYRTEASRQSWNSGGHGRETKAVAVRPGIKDIGLHDTLFATGSEDTNIKISSYSVNRDGQSSFRCLRTLRKHNTGIQHLEWSQDGRYLFSSGGFEELFVWKVVSAPIIDAGVVCESVCPSESDLPDLRIMSFSVKQTCVGDGEEKDDEFIISAVRSDSTMRVYQYTSSANSKRWQLILTGNYLTSCLTQCLNIRDGPAENLLTAGTDGHVAFWHFAEALSSAQTSEVSPSEIRPLQRFKVHQNTIHCVKLYRHNDTDYLLITGGDDSSIGITRCTWSGNADEHVEVISTLSPPLA